MSSKNKLKLIAALKQRKESIEQPSVPVQETQPASTHQSTKRKSDSQVSGANPAKKSKPHTLEHKPSQPKAPYVSKLDRKKAKLQEDMQARLQGGRFRWLNEQLYTTTSDKAFTMMQEDPEIFQEYHQGFRNQVEKWPSNPVDTFIEYLSYRPKAVVGDFGCGDAKIAATVPNTVHSFDLVAVNERVTACDIRKVPLEDASLDVAIFSLALMGVNMIEFIKEAHRTLKVNGELKIAEVRSRFDEEHGGIERFIEAVTKVGFTFKKINKDNKMFVLLDFVKTGAKTHDLKVVHGSLLKACIYKRR